MIQRAFAEKAVRKLKDDNFVMGLAVGGSWLSNDIDEFSDLDLIIVTQEKISGDITRMLDYARQLGPLLNGFTGEHVGEPRVLICLYADPILHVDIKFLTLDEFRVRIETPVILLDRDEQLKNIIDQTESKFPYPDYQWIEDRFWTWIHYALLKIGRGEYVEAFDFFGSLRMMVLGPLLHIKNGNFPRGVRKAEGLLTTEDLELLKSTLPNYSKDSLLACLRNAISLYRKLRISLYPADIQLRTKTEHNVMEYLEYIAQMKSRQ